MAIKHVDYYSSYHVVIKAGKRGTDPTIKLYPPYISMEQIDKIEFIREVKNQLISKEQLEKRRTDGERIQ
jgi:hypothetical protein